MVTWKGLRLLLALPDFEAARRHPHLLGSQSGAFPVEELVSLVLSSDLDGIYLDVASGDDAHAVLTRDFIRQLERTSHLSPKAGTGTRLTAHRGAPNVVA
jgi:hypothetical protein